MPIERLSEGIERFDGWFGVYPLLVFPLRIYDRGEMSGFLNPRGRKENLVKGKNWGIWVDLGCYGAPRAIKEGRMWDAKTQCRAIIEDITGMRIPRGVFPPGLSEKGEDAVDHYFTWLESIQK